MGRRGEDRGNPIAIGERLGVFPECQILSTRRNRISVAKEEREKREEAEKKGRQFSATFPWGSPRAPKGCKYNHPEHKRLSPVESAGLPDGLWSFQTRAPLPGRGKSRVCEGYEPHGAEKDNKTGSENWWHSGAHSLLEKSPPSHFLWQKERQGEKRQAQGKAPVFSYPQHFG